MDLENPRNPDAHSRRGFLRVAGVAGGAAAVGAVGSSGQGRAKSAVDDNGEFTDDPFALGVASGDPLADAVVLWTRLAPNPLERGGGMPNEQVSVHWTMAMDEDMDDTIESGEVLASPENAHSVHVEVAGLESNTEYYYQFAAGGRQSRVGRTKTLPTADDDLEEFTLAFASCQAYPDGFYTAYQHMAEEDLDLVIHLGDYVYEYGINANAGVRETWVPQEFRTEMVTLERYRLQYGLYKSDPNLRDAHARFPWIVTWDDHEVDNNYADEDPQDPEEQPTNDFLKRRANAYEAYFEHQPLRSSRIAQGPALPLYRDFSVGDLARINVLDTRQYRSDQACDDAFDVEDCEERFDDDRKILGTEQEDWLVDNLRNSDATWDLLANQLPFATMDFLRGSEEGYRMDQWDGYVADQNTVKEAFEEYADNPVVITGDFHANWANEIRSAEDESKTVGVEFVGTSITSGGDGSTYSDFNGDEEGVLGKHVVRENDNVKYNNNRRGYVRCRLTPDQWQADFRVVPYVEEPGAPIRTDASFVVEAGNPGLQEND